MLNYKKGSHKMTQMNFKCSEGFKDEVDRIAEYEEGTTTAGYIKGLITSDMKKREGIR